MLDTVYLLITVSFFACMLSYVAGCARLGRDAATESLPIEERTT